MTKCAIFSLLLACLGTQAFAETTSVAPNSTQNTNALPADGNRPIPTPTTVNMPAPAIPVINCHHHIPPETSKIDNAVILSWAEKAAIQTFNYNALTIDNNLNELKTCFTDQGWLGFNDAIQKSGNIAAIKAQNLTVSGQVDGTSQIQQIKDNQWKVSIPFKSFIKMIKKN